MSNTPSNKDIALLVRTYLGDCGPQANRVYSFVTAILAKWGAPPPVVRESSEDLYWELHGLSKILEGSGFIDESQHPDAYATILDAMAFVRGQQPVVREPLTTLTIAPVRRFLADRGIYLCDETTKELIVVAHGITQKGGQHGTE